MTHADDPVVCWDQLCGTRRIVRVGHIRRIRFNIAAVQLLPPHDKVTCYVSLSKLARLRSAQNSLAKRSRRR